MQSYQTTPASSRLPLPVRVRDTKPTKLENDSQNHTHYRFQLCSRPAVGTLEAVPSCPAAPRLSYANVCHCRALSEDASSCVASSYATSSVVSSRLTKHTGSDNQDVGLERDAFSLRRYLCLDWLKLNLVRTCSWFGLCIKLMSQRTHCRGRL